MALVVWFMAIVFVSVVILLLALIVNRMHATSVTMSMFELRKILMNGYFRVHRTLMIIIQRVKIILFTRLAKLRQRWTLLPHLSHQASSLLLSFVLLCGLSFALFSPVISSSASAGEINASKIIAVPTNGNNVTSTCQGSSDTGTRKLLSARGYSCSLSFYGGGILSGETFAISVMQMNSDKNFGVQFSNTDAYPQASFITYDTDSKTIYYKALTNNPRVNNVYLLQNDALYLVSAYTFKTDDVSTMQGYMNSINDLLKIVSNNTVNINNNISESANKLASKLDGVNTWIAAAIDYNKQDNAKILAELQKINKTSSNQEQKENAAKDQGKKSQQEFENGDQGKEATSQGNKLFEQLKGLFQAKPTAPHVNGAMHNVKLDFDFSSLPAAPTWLIVLEAIPAAFISIRCFARLLKTVPELIRAWRDQTMSLSMVFDFLGV